MADSDKIVEKKDCTDCKHRGASFRDVKYFCNKIKRFVEVQTCEHYETESVYKKLAEKNPTEIEIEQNSQKASKEEVIENESLDKILEFFTIDNSWTKLRRILCKDIISTTVLLNYLEYNKTAKKKFMTSVIAMALRELEELNKG